MEIYESNLDLYICCCCVYTEISYILKISLLSNLSDIKNNLVLKLELYFKNCEMNHYIINNKLTKVIEFHDRNIYMCISYRDDVNKCYRSFELVCSLLNYHQNHPAPKRHVFYQHN